MDNAGRLTLGAMRAPTLWWRGIAFCAGYTSVIRDRHELALAIFECSPRGTLVQFGCLRLLLASCVAQGKDRSTLLDADDPIAILKR